MTISPSKALEKAASIVQALNTPWLEGSITPPPNRDKKGLSVGPIRWAVTALTGPVALFMAAVAQEGVMAIKPQWDQRAGERKMKAFAREFMAIADNEAKTRKAIEDLEQAMKEYKARVQQQVAAGTVDKATAEAQGNAMQARRTALYDALSDLEAKRDKYMDDWRTGWSEHAARLVEVVDRAPFVSDDIVARLRLLVNRPFDAVLAQYIINMPYTAIVYPRISQLVGLTICETLGGLIEDARKATTDGWYPGKAIQEAIQSV